MTIYLPDTLPPKQQFLPGICRTCGREGGARLQTVVVLKNALHFIRQNFHTELIPKFLKKLKTRG